MDTDVIKIYEKLKNSYQVLLDSSLDLGFKSKNDFPVIHGQSALGKFELFFDGVSFPFYVMDEKDEVIRHFHLQTPEEAEETIIDFMEDKCP